MYVKVSILCLLCSFPSCLRLQLHNAKRPIQSMLRFTEFTSDIYFSLRFLATRIYATIPFRTTDSIDSLQYLVCII